MRSLVWATALVVTSSVAVGQPSPEIQSSPELYGKQVYAITLSQMAAPKPLSNYYLTPQYKEQQPGDQLSGFMKSTMEQHAFFSAERAKLREKFNEMSLDDLPKDSRTQAGVMGGIAYGEKSRGMMTNIDLAARYNRTEWNEYFQSRQDGFYWLLPEVQQMWNLADVLKVRLRGEVKNGEFDRAIVTVRSLTGLARMFESHPTHIGNLVGVAIQTAAWNGVEEMVAQPGCPNLFWSLVDLPTPPFNISHGCEGERALTTTQLDYLLTLDRPLTDPETFKAFDFIDESLSFDGAPSGLRRMLRSSRLRYSLLAANPTGVEAARGRLVAVGKLNATAVKAFPPLQVVLTDDLLSLVVWRDEVMKYRNLPLDECLAGMQDVTRRVKSQSGDLLLAPLMLPGSEGIKRAEARTAQRVALLRVLEALRLHAAASNGELPATLADTKLPLPLDPVTGKAFDYGVKDRVATLNGGVAGTGPRRVYEVRLRK